MAKKTVYYCGIPIEYTLTRKHVKNLNIRINEFGEILVSARKSVSVEYINSFVENKAEWIIRSLAEVERYNQVKPDSNIYQDKKVYFLGKHYTIELLDILDGGHDRVEKIEDNICIYTNLKSDSLYLKDLYIDWLQQMAVEVFNETVASMHERVKDMNIPYPDVSIKNMKSRWGSCRPSAKSITLNLQLIKTDIECIEQVVLHELLHFKQTGHNKSFYGLLDKYMPDWRERKHRLEEKYKDGI